MSLAGSLEELPLADILQIISLGRRTGILTLLTSDGRYTLSFRDGLVVSATAANGLPLGQTLVERKLISPTQLSAALELQLSGDWKPLGALLVQQNVIRYEQLEQVARAELERITQRILKLQKGNFSFQVAEVPMYGNCRLDAQEMLLEMARRHDEEHRETLKTVGEPSPAKGYVLIVNAHGEIARPLRDAVAKLGVEVHCVSRADAEALAVGFEDMPRSGVPVVVIADYEELIPAAGGVSVAWERLRSLPENASVLVTAEYPSQVTQAMTESLNALRVLERPAPRTLRGEASPTSRAVMTRLVDQTASLVAQLTAPPWTDSMHSDAVSFFADLGLVRAVAENPDETAEKRLLELLHESVTQLQQPDETTEVSLLLMRLLAECFDRAMFFLVKGDTLTGRGGFGFSAAAEKATAKVRKLRIPLAESGVFGEVYAQGGPFRGRIDPQWWTRHIPVEVGECPSRDAIIYPLRAQGGTVGLVYADNSIHHKPLRNTHVLEIFLFQAGVALENHDLRQRLLGQKKA